MNKMKSFGLVVALFSASNLAAATLTWDALSGTAGAQDGTGTWDTTVFTNWWNGSANVFWNNSTPDTAIIGNAGTAGTISLGEPISAAGMTFGAGGTGNYVVNSNVLTLGLNAVVDVQKSATISSTLGGTNVTKIGSQQLTLDGVNTLTGQMLINSGTVLLASSGALGSMTSVVLSLSVGGGGNGTTFAMQGGVTNGAGAVLEMDSNAGANRRTAFNNVSGVNTWAGGILFKGDGLNQPTSASGTLIITGDVTNQGFTGIMFIRGNANGEIRGNVDLGAGGISKTDNGTWTLGAPGKTYKWGSTTVANGTIKMGESNVLPRSTVLTIGQANVNTALFDLNGFDQTVAGLVLNPGSGGSYSIKNLGAFPATLTVSNTANYSFGGVLANGANPLNLVKSGVGILTQSGTNTYSGTTVVGGGILKIGNVVSLGSTNGGTTITSGGTLDIAGFAMNTADHLLVSGTGFNSTGAVINTGGAQQSGIRGITLQGDTMVAAWNNRWDIRGPAGDGVVDTAGFTLKLNAVGGMGIIDSVVTNSGAINLATGTLYLTRGIISGPGVISAGAGRTIILENWTSGTIDKAIALTNATLRLAGNTLSCGSALAVSGLNVIDAASLLTLTLTNGISGSGGIALNNSGTLELAGASTYAGATRVDIGTLRNVGGANRLPTNTIVSVNGDGNPIATWDLNGQNQSIASLNGTNIVGSQVKLGGGTLSFAGDGSTTGEFFGAISGAGSVVMNSGAQILSSSNTFSGGATINGGTIIVRHDSSLGGGPVTFNSGTITLDASGLWGGFVTGYADTVTANPKWTVDRKTTFANTTDLLAFPSNSTWIYTGFLNITNSSAVSWTFAEIFDDSTLLKIDGATVLNDGAWATPTMNTVLLAPGKHSFEARFGQSSGGVGPSGGWIYGFGYDTQGRGQLTATNYAEMVDPGDGSLFVRNDLNVTNDVTLNSGLPLSVPVGRAALSGTIAGSGGLTKSGAGELSLAGLLAFDGSVSATAGTLSLNGSDLGAGAITIATNAQFWGTGTVFSAATTIQAGGQIGPSSTTITGKLTLANLTLDSGAHVTAILNGTNPVVRVASNLTTSATIPLTVMTPSAVLPGTYVLIDYDGTFAGSISDFSLGTLPNGSQGYLTNDLVNTSISLVITNAGGGIKWSGLVDANWNVGTTTNWASIITDNPKIFSTLDDVRFDDSASGNFTVNVAEVVSPGSITVSNNVNDYVLGGQPISGGGSLTKQGAAILTINSPNTFTGPTTVKTGTLSIASGSSLGTPPGTATPGHLTLNSGAILQLANTATLSVNRGVAVGPSGGSGSASVNVGSGTATVASIIADVPGATGAVVKTGSGTLTLSAANSYSGGTAINDGTLMLSGAANRLKTSSTVSISTNAALNLGGQSQTLAGLTGQGSVTSSAGTLSLLLANGTSNQLDATLSGAMGFTKAGDTSTGLGVLVINSTNTFTGGVLISAGPIIIKNGGAFGNGTKTVDISNGTAGRPTLSLDGSGGNIEIPSNINFKTSSNAGTITNIAGDNVINGNFSMSSGGGGTLVRVQAGSLTIRGNMSFVDANRNLDIGGAGIGYITGVIGSGTNDNLTKSDAGTWVLSGNNTYPSGTAINGGVLQIGNGGTSGTLSTNTCTMSGGSLVFNRSDIYTNVALLAGNGSVTKSGPGTLVLEKSETYTGPTLVTNGALLVNGSLATSAVTVAAGATIGGTGTINGPVTSTGAISPGASVGTLTLASTYSQNSNAALNIEIGGPAAYDYLSVGGLATLDGALNVSLVNGYTGSNGDTFLIFTASSALGGFAATNLAPLAPGFEWVVQDIGVAIFLSVTNNGVPPAGYDAYALAITNGLTGYQDDADGDGYANLLEYVTGGNPTNADTVASMGGSRVGGLLALKFTRSSNSVDTTIIVEGASASTNNANWLGIATNIGGSWGGATNVSETGGPSLFNVTVFDSDPSTNRFLRLHVTRP